MNRFYFMLLSLLLFLGPTQRVWSEGYDPLSLREKTPTKWIDMDVEDAGRERNIPIRVFLPAEIEPQPVILFSHGLGGSRENNVYLGNHWSKRGYVVVFLQHAGSDNTVWQGVPLRDRMSKMREAASATNLSFRVKDVGVVLDRLEEWNKEIGKELANRLNLDSVGMSGHSFGAITTQHVSGLSVPIIGKRNTDKRISAALALSPSITAGTTPKNAFGSVEIPWMLMTGTKDIAPIGAQTIEARLAVYPALPTTIDKYQLVLENAEHSAFNERGLPGDSEKRNPNHHRLILALSTAFWDTNLKGNRSAREWLHSDGPRSMMEKGDTWECQAKQP